LPAGAALGRRSAYGELDTKLALATLTVTACEPSPTHSGCRHVDTGGEAAIENNASVGASVGSEIDERPLSVCRRAQPSQHLHTHLNGSCASTPPAKAQRHVHVRALMCHRAAGRSDRMRHARWEPWSASALSARPYRCHHFCRVPAVSKAILDAYPHPMCSACAMPSDAARSGDQARCIPLCASTTPREADHRSRPRRWPTRLEAS
jgi:hypothetical protein